MLKLRQHQHDVVNAMVENCKGKIIVPTGGGKTLCMITDAKREFESNNKTIVVVAPRILLAQQLCADFLNIIGEDNVNVMHVHSGKTNYYTTTKSAEVYNWKALNWKKNRLIFTTYHSLHRIQESDIDVDTIYFDEAHNSVQKNFYLAVEWFSDHAKRAYYLTATPKHSTSVRQPGMNDEWIYGQVISQIPAPELVDKGIILPPKVKVKKIDVQDDCRFKHEKDCDYVISSIDDMDKDKVLICARSTKQIVSLVTLSKFVDELSWRGYSYMYITSKTGAIVDGEKVTRQQFFDILNTWGQDVDKKFVVIHHSILSEGINVKGLEAALFLRNMNYITISQTIGRVIRKGNESKTYGLICVPVYDKVGISTSRRVEAVVDTIFNKGEPAITTLRK